MADAALAPLAPRSAFADLAAAIGPIAIDGGSGVIVTDRDGIALATVLARRGQAAALAARVRERFAIDLPREPRRAANGPIAFAGTGPDAWLATAESADGFLPALRAALGDCAAISDQSGGTAAVRLGGPRVRDALAKGVMIDLHPSTFAPGDVAVTAAAHVGLTLWRLPDDATGATFEVAVARSLAASFWHWLATSAAEYGLAVAAQAERN
jgi:sarcosine oxidase subunit gamma